MSCVWACSLHETEPSEPVLSGINITNKTELTAEWHAGDADRTIVVALSPESFTSDNTEITVTSSGEAVTVDTDDKFKMKSTRLRRRASLDASKFTYGCKNSEFQEEVMRKKFYDLLTILLLTFACVCAFAFTACATNETDPDDEPSQTVTYTVTFKQDGYADIVKTVEEGENLADIPTPATQTGYTVTWDRTDFTNITQNVTVNAVKTANTYTITYSLGANNYAKVESETQEVRYGESFTLQTPSYQGSAAFYGWYFADEKGNPTDEKAENGKYVWAKDVFVVAKWQEWSDVVS